MCFPRCLPFPFFYRGTCKGALAALRSACADLGLGRYSVRGRPTIDSKLRFRHHHEQDNDHAVADPKAIRFTQRWRPAGPSDEERRGATRCCCRIEQPSGRAKGRDALERATRHHVCVATPVHANGRPVVRSVLVDGQVAAATTAPAALRSSEATSAGEPSLFAFSRRSGPRTRTT